MSHISQFISLAPNERILKEYPTFRMLYPQNRFTTLAITNERMILFGEDKKRSKPSKPFITQQMFLEEVKGLEIQWTYPPTKKNRLLVGILFTAIGFLATIVFLILPMIVHPTSFYMQDTFTNSLFFSVLFTILGIIISISAFFPRKSGFEIQIKGGEGNLNVGYFGENSLYQEGNFAKGIIADIGKDILMAKKNQYSEDNIIQNNNFIPSNNQNNYNL